MNTLLLVIIIISILEIAGLTYLYIVFKKGFRRERYGEDEQIVHDHIRMSGKFVENISGVEYMKYNGLWDRSVKTYDKCTHVETFSPYYDFFIYEPEKGGVVLLRREK